MTEPRKTFAIISHPDAGKTTLTEKLLYFGGAIHTAGMVKSRKASRQATSDWMEIERQRGISVTSSVMQFSFDGYQINILDTPGHQDFSEDTYRTLTAADSAVMLIDTAKGVEAQTVKLFEVCRMRNIPIFTFINKMDREGRDPLSLMEELEEVLGIRSSPLNWPIGSGMDFKGVYDRESQRIERYLGKGQQSDWISLYDGEDISQEASEFLGEYHLQKLLEDIELLDIAGDPFDEEKVGKGQLSPLFLRKCFNQFWGRDIFKVFLTICPRPNATTK